MEVIFRDPVHNLISFDRSKEGLILELIETPELQRLRYIKSLGVSYLVYPSADHTRFAHSLGAAFLMKRTVDRLIGITSRKEKDVAEVLRKNRINLICAALLHDVGHFPLSHVLEEALDESHETQTLRLIANKKGGVFKVLSRRHKDLPEVISSLINGRFQPYFLSRLISSQLDVDRLDYLLRDTHHTGAHYGKFDLEWLLQNMRLVCVNKKWELAIDERKGLHALESYLLARYSMYEQVYTHKTSRAAIAMIKSIVKRIEDLLALHNSPASGNKIVALIQKKFVDDPELFLTIDDNTLFEALKDWRNEKDEVLADISSRFLSRRTFSTLELSRPLSSRVLSRISGVLLDEGFDPKYYLVVDRAVTDPYINTSSKGSRVHEGIFVLTPQHSVADLAKVSPFIGAIRNRFFAKDRICFPHELEAKILKKLSELSI